MTPGLAIDAPPLLGDREDRILRRQALPRADVAITLFALPTIPGVIRPRRVWLVLLLTVATAGFYGLLWLHAVSRELRAASRDPRVSPAANVALTVMSCGLLGLCAAYVLDRCLQQELSRALPRTRPRYLDYLALILVQLLVPGLGLLIAQALLQRDLNTLAHLSLEAHGHRSLGDRYSLGGR
jgi:Domain of unknown function (DUF4234)